jgi:hypothetical protein
MHFASNKKSKKYAKSVIRQFVDIFVERALREGDAPALVASAKTGAAFRVSRRSACTAMFL